jgi:lantibiotic biosynthesis protein
MEWHPLLTGALRDAALESATELARSLTPPVAAGQRSACLAAGSAGLAVCHAIAARHASPGPAEQPARELAVTCLDRAIEVLASQALGLSLYSGFTGIAWAADLLDRLFPDAAADRNDDIDLALAGAIWRYPAGSYDLIDGLTGLGSYALARWPRPAAAECLAGVLEQLASRARRDAHGVYWWTPPSELLGPRRELYPAGGVDLGMAHGMAGVLPLLARACALGAGEDTARPLLDGAVQWLIAHLVEGPGGRTTPSFICHDARPLPARSAWCYGDPGVAIALLLAARDVGEPGWEQAGTELALRAASRPAELSGVTEAGICHGTAGLAHLFARMHQLTGRQELAAAAVAWAERTVAMCARPIEADPAGPADPPWNGPGLLEGAAGIALVLLAGCQPAEPVWDQMLLVSTGLDAIVSAS